MHIIVLIYYFVPIFNKSKINNTVLTTVKIIKSEN